MSDGSEGIAIDHQVRVIRNITTRCTEVNDWACIGALIAVSVDLGHHIVAEFPFVFVGNIEIESIAESFELFDLGLGDRQSELLLGFGEGDPEFSPESDAVFRAEQARHFAGSIAGDQGVFVHRHGACRIGHGMLSVFLEWIRGWLD